MRVPPDQERELRAGYADRRVCVTGGAGFIGGHLVGELLGLGAEVVMIDDLSASDGRHAGTMIDIPGSGARLIFASILEPTALAEAVAGCDVVFHLAAMTSVPRSLEEPERCFQVNATGTLRVASASRAAGVRRLVFAASSSVYGDDPVLPKSESMAPRPLSPYAASKLAGESIVRAWWHSYGLSGVCLRFFNIFGPRQSPDGPYAGVVVAMLKRLMAGEAPIIYGDGSQTRDFTPVTDAVRAALLAGLTSRELGGQVMNIGCAGRTSVSQLAATLARLCDQEGVRPVHRAARPGDVPHSVADITRARALLGYHPGKSLEEGLADTVAWMASDAPAPV